MEEFKGQFDSFTKSEGENKISKVPISHQQMAAFKACSDLSTNSETSEEFRQRPQYGGDFEQKFSMDSPNFQGSSSGNNDQQEPGFNGMFPPNNFLGKNAKMNVDTNPNSISTRIPTNSNRVLNSSNNSVADTPSSSYSNEVRKYEFKSKYDEYKAKSNQQAPVTQQMPQQGSLLFDRKSPLTGLGDTTTSINNENHQPFNNIFAKNQRSNTGDGFMPPSQNQLFDFSSKYRINNDSTKNTLQNTSSMSGFSGVSGMSNINPNQHVFDMGDDSEKSYFKVSTNLTPSRMNKHSGSLSNQGAQGLNNSSNFGNFSNSFSHNNPMSLNSHNTSGQIEGAANYGRKLSVDQFKRNLDFENTLNNRDQSNDNKLQMNNLRKVSYQPPQQPQGMQSMTSNGFKSLGESRIRASGIQQQFGQMGGAAPSQNGQQQQPPLRPPKYPGSAHKMNNSGIEPTPGEIHQQMMNNQKLHNIMKKNNINIPHDILTYDQDYFPQYTMFLLAEEEKNISNFRERIEKEKQKIESDFDHMKHEMNNLLDDLKLEMTTGVDEHFKVFIDRYKSFKNEVIEFKSIKSELPNIQTPPPSQIDQKNASNIQLIKELEELRYRNQMSKLYQYIGEIQKANINRILQASHSLLGQMSSGANLYNTEGCQKNLKELKNMFAMNLSQRFDPLSNFVRSPQQLPASTASQALEMANLNNSALMPPHMQQQNSPSNQYQFSAPHPLGNPQNLFSAPVSNFNSNQQSGMQSHPYLSDSPSKGMSEFQFQFPPNNQNQMMNMNLLNHFRAMQEEGPESQMAQLNNQEIPNFGQQIMPQVEEQYSQPFPLKQMQSAFLQQQNLQQQNVQQLKQQMNMQQYSQPFSMQNKEESDEQQ